MSKKLTIEDVRYLVENIGGTLKTSEYINNHQKLDVICSKGHLYHPTFKTLKRESGCSVCYNQTEQRRAVKVKPKEQLSKAKKIAKENGGFCLSETYINNNSKLMFKCSNGHEWKSSLHSISCGSWCPVCSINSKTPDERFNSATAIAKKRGGKLLSKKSDIIAKKLTWECSDGHQWDATYNNVIGKNSWCPVCKSSFSESICRQYLEYLFETSFVKIRPHWLMGLHKYPLELDGYSSILKIAFEHQGLQHYEEINGFDSNVDSLTKRDKIKESKCKEFGISLIIIPALFIKTSLDDLHLLIKKQLDNFGIKPKKNIIPVTNILDLNLVRKIDRYQEFKSIKQIVSRRNGILHTKSYTGFNCKVNVTCSFGHTWKTTARKLKRGTWCPSCSRSSKIHIEQLRELAKSKGGMLLSGEYTNNHTKMTWQCFEDHIWYSSYNNIQKHWCPVCGVNKRANSKRLSINIYKEVAKKKGGKCLSEDVTSCYDKLEFECSNGHRWFGRGDQIKNTKQWCPKCAKNKKNA